jgi:hypothetical protein
MEETKTALNEGTHELNEQTEKTEAAKTDSVDYDTYQRAMAQRMKFKQEKEELAGELEKYKQQELEAKGKYQDVIESLRKQNEDLSTKLQKQQASYSWNVIGSQIKSEFIKKGVEPTKVDKALKFATAAHADDLKGIEVDDQYNVNSSDMQRFVDKFLADNVDMGFTKKVKVNDMSPNNNVVGKTDKKSLSKMKDDDLTKMLGSAN